MDIELLERLDQLMNAPVAFGLFAQGHVPTVRDLLDQGKSWNSTNVIFSVLVIGFLVFLIGLLSGRTWESYWRMMELKERDRRQAIESAIDRLERFNRLMRELNRGDANDEPSASTTDTTQPTATRA